jgi:hypothetical protein|nr:MAG TPA: hypothetical protein [Caudoviricetes sp.]
MAQYLCEIVVHGSHAAGMSKFLIDRGALLLRKDPPNNYVFINDNVFENALAELQIAIRRGFYFADEEVKTE